MSDEQSVIDRTGDDLTPPVEHRMRAGRRSRRWRAAGYGSLGGLTAAAVGLGTAELVAALSKRWQSPVLDVGDRVVDLVPRPAKDLAIEWFGTNDKVALLIGIGSLVALYSMVVGRLALGRSRAPALVGIGLFGLIGALSSVTTRRQAPPSAMVPSIVGATAAAAVLIALHAAAHRPRQSAAAPSIAQLVPNDRRRFLATVGFAGVAAVAAGSVGRSLKNTGEASASRRDLSLPTPVDPLGPPPAGIDVSAAGIGDAEPFFTPNADFYRIDTALTVPQIVVDDWSLSINGLVDNPMTLRYDQLGDYEIVERDITLTCVSNEVGGKLMGTARWTGVRLADVLADVGVRADADQIIGRSVDGWTSGFPVAALDDREPLIAVGMNGEPLPLAHGFPARLIVPGLYGYVSATKWLTELTLGRFDDFDAYWVERGWADRGPIKLSSRIDTPRGLSKRDAGTMAIAGVAWAQTVGIAAVDVRIDDGDWQQATLADELNDVTWRQWSMSWQATPGRHTITVRATDKNGAIQTDERSEPFPSGATGHHNIVVIVT